MVMEFKSKSEERKFVEEVIWSWDKANEIIEKIKREGKS